MFSTSVLERKSLDEMAMGRRLGLFDKKENENVMTSKNFESKAK